MEPLCPKDISLVLPTDTPLFLKLHEKIGSILFFVYFDYFCTVSKMRAPVIEFDENNGTGELAVYICNNSTGNNRCDAHLLQAINVKYLTLETVCAEDDDCINIYDEPTRMVASSAAPIDGNQIYCLKCNGMVGMRKGSLIVFNSAKLKEMIIFSYNRLILTLLNQVIGNML